MSLVMLGEVARSLREDPPRRRFVIPDLLPAGPVLLYGASGSGKTGVSIRTAVAVAAGLEWAGWATNTGAVLYVAGEDIEGAKERMVAAALALGCDPDVLPLALMSAPAEGLVHNAARIAVYGAAQTLAKTTGLPVSLIVIDTLAACFGPKSQDDATAASEFMNNVDRTARELSCAILCIHHTGKDLNAGMRGSQVFYDRADAVLRVKRGQDATSFLSVEKMRNQRDGDQFGFDIQGTTIPTAGGAISVQVVRNLRALERQAETAEEGKNRKAATIKAQMLGLLTQLAAGGAADLGAWKEACHAAWPQKSAGTRKTLFNRYKADLERDGLIRIEGQTVRVQVQSKAAPQADTDTDTSQIQVPPTVTPDADTDTDTSPPSIEGAEGAAVAGQPDHLPEKENDSGHGAETEKVAVGRAKALPRAEGHTETTRAGAGDGADEPYHPLATIEANRRFVVDLGVPASRSADACARLMKGALFPRDVRDWKREARDERAA